MHRDMEPMAWHITMRLHDGRVLAAFPEARRRATRALYRQGERHGLIAFRVADTHVHVLIACSRAVAGAFAREVQCALRARLDAPVRFEPARFVPVVDQTHLMRAFRYILRQEARHGTLADPFHDGSSLPELVGARWMPGERGALGAATVGLVAAILPRVRRRELLAELGADHERGPLVVADLCAAGAAALGVDTVHGRGVDRSHARHAVVHVAADLPAAQLAQLLAITPRAVQQLRAKPAPIEALRAVALQLRMRARFRGIPTLDAPLAAPEDVSRHTSAAGGRRASRSRDVPQTPPPGAEGGADCGAEGGPDGARRDGAEGGADGAHQDGASSGADGGPEEGAAA